MKTQNNIAPVDAMIFFLRFALLKPIKGMHPKNPITIPTTNTNLLLLVENGQSRNCKSTIIDKRMLITKHNITAVTLFIENHITPPARVRSIAVPGLVMSVLTHMFFQHEKFERLFSKGFLAWCRTHWALQSPRPMQLRFLNNLRL